MAKKKEEVDPEKKELDWTADLSPSDKEMLASIQAGGANSAQIAWMEQKQREWELKKQAAAHRQYQIVHALLHWKATSQARAYELRFIGLPEAADAIEAIIGQLSIVEVSKEQPKEQTS